MTTDTLREGQMSYDDIFDDYADDCDHEDYEADINGRASCCRCGHTWCLTDEEILAERAHQAAYDQMCRREEWRTWREDWFDRLAFWRRWRKSSPIVDDIPF